MQKLWQRPARCTTWLPFSRRAWRTGACPPAPDRNSLYIQKGLACHARANTGALTACADGMPGVRHLSSANTHRPDLQMSCLHHLQGSGLEGL